MKMINRITVHLKSNPWFLLLLPVFFIFNGYNELFGFLPAKFILLNFSVIVLSILLLYFLSNLVLKSKIKAAVLTVLISLPTLTFGYIHDAIKSFSLPSFIGSFTFIIPAVGLLFFGIFLFIKKRKKPFTEFYLFMNMLFLILILSEIPNSIKRYKLHKSVNNLIDFRFDAFNQYPSKKQIPDTLKPDIYFLLFDAMASSKSLFSQLEVDNAHLDSFLTKKGFYVAANSSANYNWTIHSVSTTFNMNYLPDWISPVMNDPKVYFWGSSSILNNSLFSILKKEGYDIKNYQPISFDNPDWKGSSFFSELRKKHFFYKTLPGRIWRDLFWNYSKIDLKIVKQKQLSITKERILDKQKQFDSTLSLVKRSCTKDGKQRFVYGHFMIPHEAYIFNENGTLRKPEETIIKNREDAIIGYKKQVKFASSVIKDLVSFIQINNRSNTIIIVAGDHGFRTETGNVKGYTFQNLNAFFFPDKDYSLLYDSISPVNTFRVVLNKYYKSEFPLLKDSNILVTEQKEAFRHAKNKQN